MSAFRGSNKEVTAHLWVVVINKSAIRFYDRLGGITTDRAIKSLLGHDFPNLKN